MMQSVRTISRLCALGLLLGAALPLVLGQSNAARRLSAPNFSPGPEYADSVRMFQGIPGIERAPNGRLWATWYGGGITEDQHNYVLLYTSGDDGRSWRRVFVLDPDRDGPIRAFDPCLWHDSEGRLWLFWAQQAKGQTKQQTFASSECLAMFTADSGQDDPKWSAPHRISRGVMMNKPIVTAGERWLLPVAVWRTDGSARVVASKDKGSTFAELGAANIAQPKERNYDEHMLVERRDGTLWILVRTAYGIGESISTDGGRSWSEVAASSIPHPVSRFFIRRLTSGRLLLVRHSPPGAGKGRSHLTAFLSEDDGRTWKGGLLLDDRSGVSYPDGVQAADGRIYVIYDFERQRAKEILLAVFAEADVLQGKLVGSNSRLRVRVNQATGVNPRAASQP